MDRYPRIVIWELTRACRLACVHCRAEAQPQRHPDELSTQQGLDLIDEIASLKKPLLILTGGDPMEREDLPDLVRRGTTHGLPVALSPSATEKVTREKILALKEANVHRMALSLDGADAETHDRFRGVPGSHQRTMEIARDIKEAGIPLQIGTTVTRHNARQLEPLAAKVGELGAILWSVFFLVPMGRAMEEMMITAKECEDLLLQLYAISRRVRFAIKTTEAPHYRRIVSERAGRALPAGAGINDGKGLFFISHRGEVCPSGFLPLAAGHVGSAPLEAIYGDSALFRSLRDPDQLKGKCRRCPYRSLCGGSRARAYAMTGDPLESDPLCGYRP